MAELTNTGFESGGDGLATAWTFLSVSGGIGATPFESFEAGWGNTSNSPFLASAMLGGGEVVETFERLWGPADGSDINLPNVVAPGVYTENASFIAVLALVASGPPLDSFESWSPAPFTLDFTDVTSISTALESFEAGWDNDTFADELIDGLSLVTTVFYDIAPQTIEKFDTLQVVDGDEIINVLTAPPPDGDYSAFINGVEFPTLGQTGDSTTLIATQLANKIATSTYPYTATQWLGGLLYVKNLTTSPMLMTVKGPVGNGSDIKIQTALYTPDYWLMPLE